MTRLPPHTAHTTAITDHHSQVPRELLPRVSLLGFSANPGTLTEYLDFIACSIRDNQSNTIFYHNLHSLYSCFTSASLRDYYRDRTILVDGMPLIWLMRLCGLKHLTREHRLTYVDFIMPLMSQARENDWQVFHIGQDVSVQQNALSRIQRDLPGIRIDGQHGYFDQSVESEDSMAIIRKLNALDTRLLLVGFGAPRQEAWIAAHRHLIKAPVVLSCGACMEYVAGEVRTPPRWMGKLGLEWSFRLLENPRRFAFRYLVEPFALALHLLRNGFDSGFRATQQHTHLSKDATASDSVAH